jgi:hypothetical protein
MRKTQTLKIKVCNSINKDIYKFILLKDDVEIETWAYFCTGSLDAINGGFETFNWLMANKNAAKTKYNQILNI